MAIVSGVAMVPLLMAAGMAVDISRGQSAKNNLQLAADAAVLYAVTSDEKNSEELKKQTYQVMSENLNYQDIELKDFDLIKGTDGSFSVDVTGKIPATFAQINGYPKLDVTALATAKASGSEGMELAIAFDTTNSMGYGATWTTALQTVKDVLTELEVHAGHENFFVSIVPFSDRVNIGSSNASWVKGATPSGWNGCVEPREESNGTVNWALDADRPVGGERFEASIPGVTGGLSVVSSSYPHCPTVEITGPTNNIKSVIDAADKFTKSGSGRFDVGLAWMWRLMSRKWLPELDGIPNSAAKDKDRRQIAIMVTDGRTTAYQYELSAMNSWGWNEGSVDGFENMTRTCKGMKADNIEIFMIRVNGNSHAAKYMQECATTPSHYFEISDNESLEIAFKDLLKVVKQDVALIR